jgi:hypothetical protein
MTVRCEKYTYSIRSYFMYLRHIIPVVYRFWSTRPRICDDTRIWDIWESIFALPLWSARASPSIYRLRCTNPLHTHWSAEPRVWESVAGST